MTWRVVNGVLEKNGYPVADIQPRVAPAGQWDIDEFSTWVDYVKGDKYTHEDDIYTEADMETLKDDTYAQAIEDINQIIDDEFDKADGPEKVLTDLLLAIDKRIGELRK